MTGFWMTGTEEPIDGSVQLGVSHEWDPSDHLRYPSTAAWRSVGLSEDEVAIDLELAREYGSIEDEAQGYYRPGTSYFISPVPAEVRQRLNAARSRLENWVLGRHIRVLESADVRVRVPLFLLGCADVEGCTATFGRETTMDRSLGWSMTIYGSGLSGYRRLSTSVSAKFSATSGQVKVVFLDFILPVERIEIKRGERTLGSGYRIEGASVRPAASPGLLLLSRDRIPPSGEEVTQFPLSGDTSGALSTYEWTYTAESYKALTLGISAFNSSLSLKCDTKLTEAISLTYELRGGYDYSLCAAGEGDGLLWGPIRNRRRSQSRIRFRGLRLDIVRVSWWIESGWTSGGFP